MKNYERWKKLEFLTLFFPFANSEASIETESLSSIKMYVVSTLPTIYHADGVRLWKLRDGAADNRDAGVN